MANRTLKRLKKRIVEAYLQNGRQKRPPNTVNVEPTNLCNLACPICPHGASASGLVPPFKRKGGFLSLEIFDKILNGCRSHIRFISLYLHGEPFLNPDLPEMARRAKDNNFRVNIFTNGLVLDEDLIDQMLCVQPGSITVSMDLISREGYLKFKGKDLYEQAHEKMDMIVSVFEKHNIKTKLMLRTIYGGENREDVIEFLDKWLSLKVFHAVQITHPFPWPRRMDADILSNRLIGDRKTLCSQLWNALNILWDGSVTPCSFDYDAEYLIGNINEAPLDVILNSREARRFRKMHLLGKRDKIPLCKNCILPRFLIEVITIHRAKYKQIKLDEKEKLLDRITNLRFSPARDFSLIQ